MPAACAGVSNGEVNRASQHVQECLHHWKMVKYVGKCRSYRAREVANQSEAAKIHKKMRQENPKIVNIKPQGEHGISE